MNFIWFILIGIAAGAIAGRIMRGNGFGIIVDLIVGVLGGVLGGWIFNSTSLIGSLITSVIGAVILLWILSLFKGHSKKQG